MKRITIICIALAFISSASYSQVGFELGLNMADMKIKSDGTSVQTKYKPGFISGIPLGMAISQNLYFEPGLFFEMAGCKLPADNSTDRYAISTITIPLNFIYKTGDNCTSRFWIGVGAYVAYNLSGSLTYDTVSYTLKFGTQQTDNMKQFDAGVGVMIGYMFKKRLYARLHYQQGLINLVPNGDSKNSITTSAGALTVGYMFGKCHTRSTGHAFRTERGSHWRGLKKNHWSTKPRYEIN